MNYTKDQVLEAVETIEESLLYDEEYSDWLMNECTDAIIYNGDSLLRYTEEWFQIEEFAVYAMDNDIL
jgi:hypothetical protein